MDPNKEGHSANLATYVKIVNNVYFLVANLG